MVVAEAFYFLNMSGYDFYSGHPKKTEFEKTLYERDVKPVSRLWIVTSDGNSTKNSIEKCRLWWDSIKPENGELRIFIVEGSGEVASIEENELIGEAIMRVALLARDRCRADGSRLYLSLAGGRKTMSTYMQKACNVWGAGLSLHIVGDLVAVPKEVIGASVEEWRKEHDFYQNDRIDAISPMFLATEAAMDDMFNDINSGEYPLTEPSDDGCVQIKVQDKALLRFIDSRFTDMKNISVNVVFFNELRGEHHENFRSLYRLPRATIERLRNERIAFEKDRKEDELAFLRALPKADLHCHLGGAASPEDLIMIAMKIMEQCGEKCNEAMIKLPFLKKMQALIDSDMESCYLYSSLALLVNDELSILGKSLLDEGSGPLTLPGQIKSLLQEAISKLHKERSIKLYHAASAFLMLFEGKAHLLEALMKGSWYSFDGTFKDISLRKYMELGDLGGSMLLQTRQALRESVMCLCRRAKEDGVRYLEIRCSPANYLDGDMSLTDVIDTLINAAAEHKPDVLVNYIFSATRHRDLTLMSRQIASAVLYSPQVSARSGDRKEKLLYWEPRVVGFDLAGKETRFRPSEFKHYFLPLFRNYLKITIHAGEEIGEAEEQIVENIWEAIYELHADRIGHGLKLSDSPSLMEMIKDRQIAIELCPSSNYQTQSFRDYLFDDPAEDLSCDESQCYPLREYYDAGLNVTINTDNWGISGTTLSQEYLKASQMTERGLSKWEVLCLVKAGFKSSFLPFDIKEELIKDADRSIYDVVREKSSHY
jgi:adenosine deaminase